MEAILNAIQKTPVPTLLILAGLLFLLLGFVNKLGGIIEVSSEQKRWTIPIGLLILTIGLVLYFTPTPTTPPSPTPSESMTSSKTPLRPSNTMGLLCALNRTGQTVFYKYRWGTGSWLDARVDVGNWTLLYWNYAFPNQNTSPLLEIMVDTDLTWGVNWQTYQIPTSAITAVPFADCNQISAKGYSFISTSPVSLSLQSP